ncbi:MAG: hypothetical protein FJ108_16600 [Deltaproteobacteria bacterium]|nr:hypothetical protein [Deltaproteobacteria bacterium]
MRSTIRSQLIRISAALGVTACLGSYSSAVDETRAGLLQLDGRDLRECLGVPSDFDIVGDLERQTYRFEGHDPFGDDFRADRGDGIVIGNALPRDRLGLPSDEPDPSYCQLDFELTNGRVTRVDANGRTRDGMNADSSCMLRARRCLPGSEEDDF